MINIGDTIYYVRRDSYGYPDKEYAEFDGQVWFRYKETPEKYSLHKLTVTGFVFHNIVGEIDETDKHDYMDFIYLRDDHDELIKEDWDKEKQKIDSYSYSYDFFFTDEQEAIKKLNLLNEEYNWNNIRKKEIDSIKNA